MLIGVFNDPMVSPIHVFRIDVESANPLGLYHIMGSPAVPTADQRFQLMAASEVQPVPVPISNGSVTVVMPPNSAVMITFA